MPLHRVAVGLKILAEICVSQKEIRSHCFSAPLKFHDAESHEFNFVFLSHPALLLRFLNPACLMLRVLGHLEGLQQLSPENTLFKTSALGYPRYIGTGTTIVLTNATDGLLAEITGAHAHAPGNRTELAVGPAAASHGSPTPKSHWRHVTASHGTSQTGHTMVFL